MIIQSHFMVRRCKYYRTGNQHFRQGIGKFFSGRFFLCQRYISGSFYKCSKFGIGYFMLIHHECLQFYPMYGTCIRHGFLTTSLYPGRIRNTHTKFTSGYIYHTSHSRKHSGNWIGLSRPISAGSTGHIIHTVFGQHFSCARNCRRKGRNYGGSRCIR